MCSISLLQFYKSDPFKFLGNFTDVTIMGHVTVIWSPVPKDSVRVLLSVWWKQSLWWGCADASAGTDDSG